jgi:hypothetical protein
MFLHRQPQGDGRAAQRARSRGDLAGVGFGDRADDGQAEAEVARGVAVRAGGAEPVEDRAEFAAGDSGA